MGAGTFVFVVLGIHALGDMRRLGMKKHFDLGALPMEAFLFIADVPDRLAGGVDENLGRDLLGSACLPGNDDAIRRGKGFAGNPQILGGPAVFRPEPEKGIHHFVGDPVADLVGMTFRNGFASKQIAGTLHLPPSSHQGARFYRESQAGQWVRP
jgi:hypothetical protein